MSQTHDLKCWPEFFRALWNGSKTAEIRRNDRGYQAGDVLHMREWIPEYDAEGDFLIGDDLEPVGAYTGRTLDLLVTHIVQGPAFGIKEGYVMMSVCL